MADVIFIFLSALIHRNDKIKIFLLQLYKNLTSTDYAEILRQKIDDKKTYADPLHYGAEYETSADRGTSHVSIIAPNGDAIAVTSSVNF